MTDGGPKFPRWQVPLQELLLEFDRENFNRRKQRVESLLQERIQKLDQGNDGQEELRALNFALSLIRMTERDRFTKS
jgi:hypothetical protein